jgi:hypothetical protein
MKKSKYLNRTLAAAVLGCLAVSSAKAAMVDYNIVNSEADLETFNLNYNSSGSTMTTLSGALAGGIQIQEVAGGTQSAGLPTTYTSVCTDVGGTVYLGQTYGYDVASFSHQTGIDPSWGLNANGGTIAGGNSLAGEEALAIQNAASIFYNHFTDLGNAATPTENAAVQLAVWAALYNTAGNGSVFGVSYNAVTHTGSIDTSGARFQVTSGDSAAINLAASWLVGLTGSSTYQGDLLYPDPQYQNNGDGNPVQELLLRTQDAPPVPEPSTIVAGALLLLPFGASTLRVFRKNRAA